MVVQIGWKVDVNACAGCRACEMACVLAHGLKIGQGRRRRVIEKYLEEDGVICGFFLSLTCNQCESPACIAACPLSPDHPSDQAYDPATARVRNALWKDTSGELSGGVIGVVRAEADKCIGCRRCEWACPFGAPQFNPTIEKIHKCDMCWDKIADTTLHVSQRRGACAVSCSGRAITPDWIDTDPAGSYDFSPTKRFDILSSVSDVGADHGTEGIGGDYVVLSAAHPRFIAPGYPGRGSAYVADANMTNPALKIRNRFYVSRDGASII